jgi:hypothetical protein
MSNKSDQMYLRVRNISDSDLIFSDLQDEENAQENKGVQTYLEAGEKVDLPLDGDVLHSYEQGSIGGYEDDGKVEASPFQADRNELWVGPEGDDENPGTRNAPLGSIQTAIDRLDENFGLHELKTVKIKSGTDNIEENFVINTQTLRLQSETLEGDDLDDTTQIVPADESRPICTITNMTKDEVDQFEDDGGLDYTWSPPNSYSYTGASFANRDTRDLNYKFSEVVADMKVQIEGIAFTAPNAPTSATPEGLAMIGVPVSGDQFFIRDIHLTSVNGTASGSTPLFAKNAQFVFANSVMSGDEIILDEFNISFEGHGMGTSDTRKDSDIGGDLITAGDSNTTSDEGGLGFNSTIFSYSSVSRAENVYITESVEIPFRQNETVVAGSTDDLVHDSSNDIGASDIRKGIECGSYRGLGSGNLYAATVRCEDFTHSGTGVVDINHLVCQNGGATFSGGTGHLIEGGTVQGNFTVSSGTDVELRGVTIEGNLDVNDANTTVHLKGCHIQGDINIEDQSGVSVTMDGGSYMGSLTDPGTNFNRNTGS